jgi:hypothetical protein
MSDLEERGTERPGIGRRTLIKRAAAVGAVAWAAPTIIGSLKSPAGAVTGGFPATCSYMILVVKTGDTVCAVKVLSGATTCTSPNTNDTSSDSTFSRPCDDGAGGTAYSNTCGSGNNPICRTVNGVTAVVPACSSGCPVTVNGGTVTANAGSTILFAVAHSGSCGQPPNAFCPSCCNTTSCNGGC